MISLDPLPGPAILTVSWTLLNRDSPLWGAASPRPSRKSLPPARESKWTLTLSRLESTRTARTVTREATPLKSVRSSRLSNRSLTTAVSGKRQLSDDLPEERRLPRSCASTIVNP